MQSKVSEAIACKSVHNFHSPSQNGTLERKYLGFFTGFATQKYASKGIGRCFVNLNPSYFVRWSERNFLKTTRFLVRLYRTISNYE